ncbi:MAG TPA: hypothetical protein VMG30_20195 [Acidobacteriota bacterium]|nr:hypothetical protein [Acidobacteriota bacterium]
MAGAITSKWPLDETGFHDAAISRLWRLPPKLLFAHLKIPFASPCDRWENGTQTTVKMSGVNAPGLENMVEHDCSPKGLVITTHGPRRFLVDVEAGTVVAYVLFAGGLPDFHMFKMRNGKVEMIQAVIGAGAKSMGWPTEQVCKQ